MSRYTSRYESDRRSRSPRDRSPDRYNDRTSQYSDGDRRRLSGESRSNQLSFQLNRDGFRDSLTGREPPRGPKALLDPPSGPRGGYSSDFRGGRGGRGRGRGWRDDSRDRGRDRDDFRDRRDFRDDRSRERDNRDWRDRERDNFRGRRLSPPGRPRSPPGRDFRDRDVPLGVDADRARRGSRDGPLSAGSSSSDPAFAIQPYRDDIGRMRGKRPMRGQGWGSASRGRPMYMDDRDHRYPPSPLQESRWGRDEDRDVHRRDPGPRDPRDDRDTRDRDSMRPKPSQYFSAHGHYEPPPTAKDVSSPPLAPSAPPFGSVSNRNPSMADIQSLTGKAPPTGPRALTEDRPVSAGQSTATPDRFAPPGPAKPTLLDNNPLIPVGPRAQQKQQPRPSSKQWINPNLAGRKVPDSPKINRSQSFVSQQGRPFGARPTSSHSDHQTDYTRRPRSSDANAEGQLDSADGQLHSLRISEPGEIRDERETQSARGSVDRDNRGPFSSQGLRPYHLEPERPQSGKPVSPASYKGASPTFPGAAFNQTADKQATDTAKALSGVQEVQRRAKLSLTPSRIFLPHQKSEKPAQTWVAPALESDDDDEEDMSDYFDKEIAALEAEERKGAEVEPRSITDESIAHAGWILAQFVSKLVDEPSCLENVLAPIPEGLEWPRPIVETKEGVEPDAMAISEDQTTPATAEAAANLAAGDVGSLPDHQEPKPKVEEVDTNNPQVPIPTVEKDDVRDVDEDVVMDDAPDATMPTLNGHFNHEGLMSPPVFGQSVSRQSTASQMDEDDDATEIEDADYLTLETVRHPMATPPLDDIPTFSCVPWYKDKRFMQTLSPKNGVNEFIVKRMTEVHEARLAQEGEMRHSYADRYKAYLDFTMSDDPAAAKSREKFAGGPICTDPPPSIAGPEPKPEGRVTNRRFASERDMQRILEESMREENERKEREARSKKEKYRSEKEADIPEMCWTPGGPERQLFVDRCGYLAPEKLIAGLQVLPPNVNFTVEEAELFEQAYLEFPKQWGRIADRMPNRDFHASIQYYYARKRDLNLKEKLRKQPRKRKKQNPRGKQRSSALVSELGNGEIEGDENTENGENGERRRPRRAAAPTFGDQTPAADSDGNTPVGTPGRRAVAALASKNNDSGAEKVEGKKKRGRAVKEKEPKQPKLAQAIAPTPAPGAKAGPRSRSNSRVQMPGDWAPGAMHTDNGFGIAGREPLPAGMQPPTIPLQQGLVGQEGTAVPASAPTSDVMAPPALRPEPPPPQAGNTMFDASQLSGQERARAGLPTSYWSVSEMHDFPALLKSFGSDWTQMANHMQSKTATMVKNYFQRGKEGKIERACKEEWETLAAEADLKRHRGEKRPDPPAPSSGQRKRYDVPSGMHRPLAVADAADGMGAAKLESQPLQQAPPFTSTFKVPVPIAQAPPAQPPLPPSMQQQPQLQLQSPQGISQAMSPPSRVIKAPGIHFGYSEREADMMPQKQPLRMPPKQPTSPIAPVPVAEPLSQHRTASWPTPDAAVDDALKALTQKRRHQASETQQRDDVRQPEHGPAVRLKQDPDAGRSFEPFAHPQLQARAPQPTRGDPLTMARQPEQPPPRTLVPAQAPSAYPPAAPHQQQSMRALLAEPSHHQPRELERPMSGGQRPGIAGSMSEPYSAPAPPAPSPAPTPGPSPAPAAPRPPTERKVSSLMGLLNDDPAPPPKRIPEVVSTMKPSSTPPPQPMARPPPVTSAPPPLRREPERESYSPFVRSQGGQSAMPPLNPYAQSHTQSPQPQHMPAPRAPVPDIGNPAEREYYSRHPYHQQHQPQATNSPQSHSYPASGQQSQMGYQPQPPSYAQYGAPSSQPHSASPTPQYASHAPRGREPLRPPKDVYPPKEAGWSSQEPRSMSSTQQQQPAQLQQHQQQQAPQHRQQSGWPPSASHQPPPKVQPPAQSAWAAQHGGPPKPPTASSSNQPPSSWSSAPPQQQQALHMPMRDERGFPLHDRAQHQHSHSLSGGYPAPPIRGEAPPASQQPYSRYSNAPGPGQPRDPGSRSFTPAPLGYDNRGPPQHGPGPGPDPRQGFGGQEHRDMLRDPRDVRGDPRDQQPPQQPQPPNSYPRTLRPHDEYNRPPDRYH